jgi:hypothetical protein
MVLGYPGIFENLPFKMDGQTLKPINSKLSWMLPAAGKKCLIIYLGKTSKFIDT